MKRATQKRSNNSNGPAITSVISQPFSGRFGPKAQDFAVKCSELFATGADTMEIAAIMKKPEYAVYNALARLGQ